MESSSQFARSAARARVLFVDDDPTIRNDCVEIGRTLGYEAS